MLYTAVVLATAALVYLLWQFRLIILLFFLSMIVAAMIRPFTGRLRELGLPEPWAQLLVYLLIAVGVLFLILMLGDLLLSEANDAINKSIINYESLHRSWEEGEPWQQWLAGRLPEPFSMPEVSGMEVNEMLPAVLDITVTVTSLVGGLLLLIALSLYWSLDQQRFERLWLSLLPARRRIYARDTWREVETAAGGYLRSQLAQSILAAVVLGAGGFVAGFPYPIILGLFGSLMTFIPLFGGFIAAFFALLLGSMESSGMALGAAVYTVAVFLVLELLVEPRLWPRDKHSFLLTILVIVPLVDAFGIWGLVAAPLLSVAFESLIKKTFTLMVERPAETPDLENIEDRYRQVVERVSAAGEDEAPPELKNLTVRLAKLLADSRALDTL
jgi:predicted PurR-regulated permease PerM